MYFTPMNTALCIILLISVKILINYISKSNKKLPPGPPALPILGHLHLVKQPLHQALHEISKQYGPAVFLRFGSRPVLVVSNQALAEKCFTTHDLAFSNRVHLPTVMMQPGLIVWANYGSYWRTVRQAAAVELLSSQQLQNTSKIRAEEFRAMALQLYKVSESQKKSEESNGFLKLNFKKMLFELMMNAFLIMVAGKRAYGTNMDASDEVKKFSETLMGWFELTGASNIEDFLPLLRILDLKGTMKKMRHIIKGNEEMMQKMIDENRQDGIGRGTP